MVFRYKVVFTNCMIKEEDVLGPMPGAVVRRVEVSKCKVNKDCYISLLHTSPNVPSINAVPTQSVLL
jgi:hypothetical protein